MTKRLCGMKRPIILRHILTIAAVFLLFALVFVIPVSAADETTTVVVGNSADVTNNNGDVYDSIQAAINAADKGDIVKLLTDVELSETLTIANTQNIILDLNGKSITVTKSGDRSLYAFDNKGTLTLTDSVGTGSITARGNYNYGTLVMNGGTIIACDTNGGYGVWNYGDFTMNGGTIKVTHVGSYADQYGPTGLGNTADAKALITGGTFDGKNTRAYIIASNGEMTINPAEGKDVCVKAPRAVAVDGGKTTINGGTFATYDSRYVDGVYTAYETYYPLYVSNGKAIVNGGTFNAPEYSVQVGHDPSEAVTGTVTINGGTFTSGLRSQDTTRSNDISIFGGTFSTEPEEEYLPADYESVKVADKEWILGLSVSDQLEPRTVSYTGTVNPYVLPETLNGYEIVYSQDGKFIEEPINVGTYNVTVYHVATDKNYVGELIDGLVIQQADLKISFANSALSKYETDETFTNPITYTGDGTLSYTSSNETVATVDSTTGEVTIKVAGTTTITVTASETENCKEATETYTLNVYASQYAVTGTGNPEGSIFVANDVADTDKDIINETIKTQRENFSEGVYWIDVSLIGADGNLVKTPVTFTVAYADILGSNAGDHAKYKFFVLHLNGGTVEPVNAVPGQTGLLVGSTTLSPFAIGYSLKTAGDDSGNGGNGGNNGGSSTTQGSSVWLTESQTPTETPEQPTEKPTDSVPTDVPTTQPTTEPESPGFGVISVLAGLSAVAVLRRK